MKMSIYDVIDKVKSIDKEIANVELAMCENGDKASELLAEYRDMILMKVVDI